MANLEVKYLGLTLKNPIIVSSCGLTSTLDKLKRIESAGAGAVVLKSIFEEQLSGELTSMEAYSEYPEAADYLQTYLKEDYISGYLKFISNAKSSLEIPVIASISCTSKGEWVEYARKIAAAGADALELNIFILPTDATQSGSLIEQNYLQIVQHVTAAVNIPVSVKIGQRFTNILEISQGIKACGAQGIVMFNRFFEPDINIDSMSVVEADIFSSPSELRNSIRWVSMVSSRIKGLDIAASTGIHTGDDVIKVLLAGANTAEICTALYRGGLESIQKMTDRLSAWIDRNGFESIEEFRGKLNYNNVSNPMIYERAQFMKYFASK